MKKISAFALLSAGLICMSSSTSYAGNRPGALTLKLGGGYIFLNDKRDMQDHALGLAAVTYNLTDHWGVQGLIAGFKTDFDKSVNDDHRVDATLFNFDGVYHFMPDSVFEPYVAAGVGLLGLNPNRADAHNQGNVNAALGVQLFAANSFAIEAEARDLYTWVGGKNDVMLSAGVSWLIDLC